MRMPANAVSEVKVGQGAQRGVTRLEATQDVFVEWIFQMEASKIGGKAQNNQYRDDKSKGKRG
jgi:hypothetical protein